MTPAPGTGDVAAATVASSITDFGKTDAKPTRSVTPTSAPTHSFVRKKPSGFSTPWSMLICTTQKQQKGPSSNTHPSGVKVYDRGSPTTTTNAQLSACQSGSGSTCNHRFERPLGHARGSEDREAEDDPGNHQLSPDGVAETEVEHRQHEVAAEGRGAAQTADGDATADSASRRGRWLLPGLSAPRLEAAADSIPALRDFTRVSPTVGVELLR